MIVVAEKRGEQWVLRTQMGNPIGQRLLTVAAEPGKELPDLQDTFDSEPAARRAALRWNMYLRHARSRKSR